MISGFSTAELVIAAIVLVSIFVALRRAYRYWEDNHKKHGFWYEVVKDFIGPLVIAIVGIGLGILVDKQRAADSENQSKAAILREMMTSRNGPDVAFFTAVGEQLTVHLQRYDKIRAEAQTGGLAGEKLKSYMNENALFDEAAIYFFYGMFRVAIVDFMATKGYVLYPRIWMEEAFEKLTDHVVEDFTGIKERDPRVSPQEGAALYRYFGASKATYHTSSERSNESVPDLFEFNLILTEKEPPASKVAKDPYYSQHTSDLRKGFGEFQKRLRNGEIKCDQVILAFEAMIGLDDYAFNTFFAAWYNQFDSKQPVNLSRLLGSPPRDFLPFPLHTFQAKDPAGENDEWQEERKRAWQLILENVPTALKTDIEKTKKAPASP